MELDVIALDLGYKLIVLHHQQIALSLDHGLSPSSFPIS